MVETVVSAIRQVYPDYALDGEGSPSLYRLLEAGRGVDYAVVDADLRQLLALHLDEGTRGWAGPVLSELGVRCGTALADRADVYDRVGHELVRYDRFGRDVSRVAHHPDWVASLDEVFDFGLAGWNYDPARLERYGRAPVPLLAALDYLVGQADMALCCPLELAHGTVAILERFATAEQRARFLPAVVATNAGDRMQVAQVATEITGGSDVGATRTVARRTDGGRWELTGEKWFASNVGADLIVTLGRVDEAVAGTKGLGLFVVPRLRGDGAPNGISVRRLKDKMGTIGVPTGELLFDRAEAHLIGQADQGFRYMAEMLNHTRFWNAVGSVGIMRRAFLEASAYTSRRRSFGTTLDAFPMVRERLVWLQVDLAATLALLFTVAATLEEHESAGADDAHLRFRTLAPVVKYRSGEQNVDFARAAIELLGANGYVNTFGTPRLLRDAQVNPIWEGTSNICALDLWRAIDRQRGHEPVFAHARRQLDAVRTPAGRAVAEHAHGLLADAEKAIEGLAAASAPRQQQQARRLADLVGDAVALAAMAAWADHDAATEGDHRPALVAELFALRQRQPAAGGASAVLDGFAGVPEVYPALVAEGGLGEDEHRAARRALGLTRA